MMALHGIEIDWLRPQCLPVNLQSHGLVWKAVSTAMSLAEFSVRRREPLDAEYWDKLALALWFKTWKPLAEFQITSSHFLLLYLFKVAQDLKLDCGHAGKHKVASDGIRSTKALIQHFSPGKMSHHSECCVTCWVVTLSFVFSVEI